MIVHTCPKCGGDLMSYVIATYPPISVYKCLRCDWRFEERDVIERIPLYKTNADRSRSMTDEELAEWLYVWAGGAPNCDRELSVHPDNKSCRECWLDWLKQESNDG